MKHRFKKMLILFLTELVLMSSVTCHVKKGNIDYIGRNDNISEYNYEDGRILIVNPENIDNANNIKGNKDALVLDMRDSKNPGMKVVSSTSIDDTFSMKQIVEAMQDYNEKIKSDSTWNRTTESMILEWQFHNFLHDLGLYHDRTKDVDFNNDELKNLLK